MAVMIGLRTGTSPDYWLENPGMIETAVSVIEEWSR